MEKTFEENSRGNVANILNFYYENKIEVPKDLLNVIDFTEEFKKDLILNFQNQKEKKQLMFKKLIS